jgi:hypothetical protein
MRKALLVVCLVVYTCLVGAANRGGVTFKMLEGVSNPNIAFAGGTADMASFTIENDGKDAIEILSVHVCLSYPWNTRPSGLKSCQLNYLDGTLSHAVNTGASVVDPSDQSQSGDLQHLFVNEIFQIAGKGTATLKLTAQIPADTRGAYTWGLSKDAYVEYVSLKTGRMYRSLPVSPNSGVTTVVYGVPQLSISTYGSTYQSKVMPGNWFGSFSFTLDATNDNLHLQGFNVSFPFGGSNVESLSLYRSKDGLKVGDCRLVTGKEGVSGYCMVDVKDVAGQDFYLNGKVKNGAPLGTIIAISVEAYGTGSQSGMGMGTTQITLPMTYVVSSTQ